MLGNYLDQVTKAFKENISIDEKQKNIEKLLEETEFGHDLRFFLLINGIFDKNIYRNIRNLVPFIKNVN